MNLKATSNVEINRYKLEITVGNPQWADAVRKAFNQKNKSIQIAGFRKGKAPRNIIEKMYGEGFFYEDALNLIYSDVIEQAVEEAKLDVVDKHNIDFDLVNADKEGIEFTIIVTTKPEVKLKEYKNLSAEKIKVEVADKEIEDELKKVCEGQSRMIEVTDRAVMDGDTAVIDFEGFKDGVAFDGGKSESHPLVIGSGSFIPGFEENVIGHNIGDEFEIEVAFPEEYHVDDLKGQPVLFKIKLHEIKAKELPEIDDEFAKDVSEFDNLADFKADISAKILDRKSKQTESDYEEALFDLVIDGMEAEIPHVMIENRIDENIKEFSYRLQSQGLDLKTYIQFTGGNIEEFRGTFAVQAEKQVRTRLVLEEIAKLEKLDITDEAVEAEYVKLSESYKADIADVKAAISVEAVRGDLSCNKAVDLVKESAIAIEKTEAEVEKAAKEKAKKAEKAVKVEGETETKKETKAPVKKKPTKKATEVTTEE